MVRHAGVQVACLRHFQSEPLSVLVPAAAEGPEALAQACERLPAALRNSIAGSTARRSIGRVVTAWRSWAVSIRWLHEAAQALGMGHSAGWQRPPKLHLLSQITAPGHSYDQFLRMRMFPHISQSQGVLARSSLCMPCMHARDLLAGLRLHAGAIPLIHRDTAADIPTLCHAASDGLSLTSLYVDTSDPAYMAQGCLGQKRLRSLCAKLEEVSEDRCRQLLQAMVGSCELVAEGAQAVKDDLACVKVVTRPTLHQFCPHVGGAILKCNMRLCVVPSDHTT